MATKVEQKHDMVVRLADHRADDPEATGAKASALASAVKAGLPVLDGVVLTTEFAAAIDEGDEIVGHPAVETAFDMMDGDRRRLVARSSSTLEDQGASSMAGQFDSIIGIDGLAEFEAAVRSVLSSRAAAGLPNTPIAVLVQPLLDAKAGGVMFGVDPVTGRSDPRVISAVAGAPEPLVSGEMEGSRYVIDEAGAIVDEQRNDGVAVGDGHAKALLRLVDRAAAEFGRPQDIEWGLQRDGDLVLLQSRAVTTEIRGVPRGPVFGPGPVAETFPEPLTRLEQDLWVEPLREAVREAVRLAGTATPEQIRASEAVTVVDGMVAIDLDLTGENAPNLRLRDRLNPVPAVRRLRSAWRVGRLRAALPGLADDLVDRVDADLEAAPPLTTLTSRQLVALAGRGRQILRALHAQEMLMGLLTDPGDSRMTGASVALRILSEGRRDGMSDEQIITASPIVLALTAPRICNCVELPPPAQTEAQVHIGGRSSDNAVLREALRLRVRWTQEITGRALWEIGRRLAGDGTLTHPEDIRHLGFDDVESFVAQRVVRLDPGSDVAASNPPSRLPARFRLSDRGRPIAVVDPGCGTGGTGAGGGVGSGMVSHDADDPPPGSVLVTEVLRPGIGPYLSSLSGIIAETGSVLSHLAILAREAGVPIVVGHAGALEAYAEGTTLTVDGDTGEVAVEDGSRDGPS